MQNHSCNKDHICFKHLFLVGTQFFYGKNGALIHKAPFLANIFFLFDILLEKWECTQCNAHLNNKKLLYNGFYIRPSNKTTTPPHQINRTNSVWQWIATKCNFMCWNTTWDMIFVNFCVSAFFYVPTQYLTKNIYSHLYFVGEGSIFLFKSIYF